VSIFKADTLSTRARRERCHSLFRLEPDAFWQHHYHFEQQPSRFGITLGRERVNDLLMNAVLPIVLLYARLFKDQMVRTNTLSLLESFPLLQDNSITRTLQRQLVKTRGQFTTAFRQQGGIQLYKMFCSPVRCNECEIGKYIGVPPLVSSRE
jgi:hypothetical protein